MSKIIESLSNNRKNEFKKLVTECNSVNLTQRTASRISRYHVEKGYGKWYDIVLPFLVSRESTDPTNLIKPLTQQINLNEKMNIEETKRKEAREKSPLFNEIIY